jgi:hypothetical protein
VDYGEMHRHPLCRLVAPRGSSALIDGFWSRGQVAYVQVDPVAVAAARR